ncbi:GNAT family N-acetyltransferase [Tessaracoccus sp. HDW20]|uniref:GNAT family N-acetyltransferase n=1 Tax=Tessaracoccus coleopterorum TaxID=2714950 RepID=UPI0018D43B3C|nr:GNAT family N-acetyltransferase [Tessaracoccus coleopterorum]NHB84475.1 GNAT family N-acetyltransferase [Tessaracoccus coleopterorum]
MPADFADLQRRHRDGWVAGLAAKFSSPAPLRGSWPSRTANWWASRRSSTARRLGDRGRVRARPAGRELSRLYVAPSFQGTGLAASLFEAIDDGSDLYLWLIDGNERGRRFYLRRGSSIWTSRSRPARAGATWRCTGWPGSEVDGKGPPGLSRADPGFS